MRYEMLIIWLTLTLVVLPLHGIQVDFERFEQLSGFEYYNSSLRVRKYNRTTMALNGTLQIMQPLNTNFIVSTDLFHSSLGNQQFNHYPMKLPTENLCDFVARFYADYADAMEGMSNYPEPGECPLVPRSVYVVNKVFPTKAVPKFFASGLWKICIINSLGNVPVVRFEMTMKVQRDLFS